MFFKYNKNKIVIFTDSNKCKRKALRTFLRYFPPSFRGKVCIINQNGSKLIYTPILK